MRTFDPIAAGERVLPPATEFPPVRSVSRFVPDLALSMACVAVLYLLLVAGGPSALFRDADAGWHIRAGQSILATRSLPVTDPFSFSKAGEPWIAWEWIPDLAAALAHSISGLSGVALIYALAIGAAVWMWFRLSWTAGGNFILACVFAAPLLSALSLHWLARPHVFGWLFSLAAVWFCESLSTRNRFVSVALLSALWANVHGSFVLAPAIFLIYATGSALRPLMWGGDAKAPWQKYILYAVCAAAGSLVNPHGWNLHRHIFAYLNDSALLDRIGEFQSFNFHSNGSTQIILAMIICLAGGFAALSARRPERFLLSLILTAAALRTARMLPIAALLLLPLANGSISDVLTHTQLAPRFRKLLDDILNYGSGLRALDQTLGGLALIPLIAVAFFGIILATRPAFPANQFPVAASASVAALPAEARLFSSDKFGGYLIYRFSGQRKVFFDGRSDFYGAEFLRTYTNLVQARPGWQSEFANYGFTHALLPPDSALVAALESTGWTETYRDRTAILLKGPQS